MLPFSFAGIASLHVEFAGVSGLGPWMTERIAERRLLVVTDQGLYRSGALEPALQSLRSSGCVVSIFDRVVADPPEAVVMECLAQGQGDRVEAVVGFGGGSSMDVAKIVALLLCTPQEFSAMYGIGRAVGERLPLVQIPTTAGTGSEATNITILTTPTQAKMGVVARQLFCDHVFLDAELTLGLPPLPTAATGIDAMVHAIEAFTSRHRKNPCSDMFAREALRLLDGSLVTACKDGANRAAREAMLLGAHLAGQAFASAPVAAVHALAYPLGSRCHIPHGLANALMLGPVLRFNMQAAAA
jgi:alcohol dehydrogenase class IV